MKPVSIGFLGAGKMATALARGVIQAGVVPAAQVIASDPVPAAREAFAQATGARVTDRNAEVVAASDLVVVAVKPDQVVGLLSELSAVWEVPRHLVVSIAAGVTLARMEAAGPAGLRIIRVMPNTPALVGASASAFAVGTSATRADAGQVQGVLGSVGLALEVKEKLLDAVTGVSGSGPAYGFLMIEALADGGSLPACPGMSPSAWRRRPCWEPPRWCWRPGSIREPSRTRCAAPVAPPSRPSTRWRRGASWRR